ncbi:hypothetical protein HMPREF0580_1593 [Mobiluncus mulieris ATCC 35239]|uniref:Uncharacterized protein n=2 Tax=Mobiluncus mulieris TaxID=2052 RepID=E0QRS8_9ACTO|nr:hypothetical protein [Mobiluncus mulieris]EFM45786.1 hypothetical protein HMPREF0580_1593 [Mobiluncus mulieris ATCC 35239]MCU9968211.1 RNA polymerase subunit sigma [Mobiluncus mulieris]MCU9970298.1 RNA polymerase subunit sigma [Mobiluncus mulieris]MCU9972390.1 RNA polymerase subunit sigma [Mobiluncus mulieris]MCU9974761.1 RNA polymerase subunit sigma [Mobiluncus mulieris]
MKKICAMLSVILIASVPFYWKSDLFTDREQNETKPIVTYRVSVKDIDLCFVFPWWCE